MFERSLVRSTGSSVTDTLKDDLMIGDGQKILIDDDR